MSAATVGLTSAGGLLSLLGEPLHELRVYALSQLDELADQFWAEIAAALPVIEGFADDATFSDRHQAAVLASKVHYHLGEMTRAVQFALKAGDLFDFNVSTEFSETILAKCVDDYIAHQSNEAADKPALPDGLEAVVNLMFQRCLLKNELQEAVGVAIEARRLDIVQRALEESTAKRELLAYCFDITREFVSSSAFRHEVFRMLVSLYGQIGTPDYVNILKCFVYDEHAQATSDLLQELVFGSADDALVAFQLAFDLVDTAPQAMLLAVQESIANAAVPDGDADAARKARQLGTLRDILSGGPTLDLNLQFLCHNNHTDLQILTNLKNSVDPRNSICHTGIVLANAIMHCGVTSDSFLRDNFEWLRRATNWAQFTATASIGVIHRGHLAESMKVLAPYLPGGGNGLTEYVEGGSLYALGLIHAGHGKSVRKFLLDALSGAGQKEAIQHGACLGLGLAGLGSQDTETVDMLFETVLRQESAVAGEAAGLCAGMLMIGAPNAERVSTLMQKMRETPHEKIIRGAALGVALMHYQREEAADEVIESMTSTEDAIIRYGGMFTIALAYVGTAKNKAIRQLLHVAVSDVNDDVRRAAVCALGFVLCNEPDTVPRIVSLLAESYNPHVRYGAAMAIGIACAGTALKAAVDVLETLSSDSVDFVRQGAFMALAMVLIQATNKQNEKCEAVRESFRKVVAEKHEDVMAKFGAILAAGIIDAGGRNVTIGLQRRGHLNMAGVVGLTVFLQYWYWFPMTHFINLAFWPTASIALNQDLKMPEFKFRSNAAPSLFAYPPKVSAPTSDKPQKVEAAVLSTTVRAQKRKAEKAKASGTGDATASPKPADADGDVKMAGSGDEKPAADGKADSAAADDAAAAAAAASAEKKDEPEPTFELLSNPSRVTLTQEQHVSLDADERYVLATPGKRSGIIVLRDTKPGEAVVLVDAAVPKSNVVVESEPEAPEPFEYPFDD